MNHHKKLSDPTLTVLIANPSPDVYGSDLQMLQTVSALRKYGAHVTVAMPKDGPLVRDITRLGAAVEFIPFPVLRRSDRSIIGLVRLLLGILAAIPRLCNFTRGRNPDALYVNTVTLPWWLLVGRLTRVPTICHVHEAETQDGRLVRRALIFPLLLARAVIVISQAAMQAMCDVAPRLAQRSRLIYNGVPFPSQPPVPAQASERSRLLVVGRLSPRKAPHVALEALSELLRRGRDVELEVAGSSFAGYEWYERELRDRASRADLAGRVRFSGYCSPIWPVLAQNDIVVAPSLREPFGNAVVEAQLAHRPVVASAALGHLESIIDGQTGLLVPPGDARAMADAVEQLMGDQSRRAAIVTAAAQSAIERFSTERYGREVFELITDLVDSRSAYPGAGSPSPALQQLAPENRAAQRQGGTNHP